MANPQKTLFADGLKTKTLTSENRTKKAKKGI
jgi:hypothetical protein